MFSISVLVNTAAIIIGSILGVFSGKNLSDKYKDVLFKAIGLLTLGLGVKMFFDYHNAMVVLGSMVIGGLIGEWFDIEARIGRLTGKKNDQLYVKGFITATVLFLAGPMTVIGSIQAGAQGNNEIIFIKSLMDGISSVMLAASFGTGVLLSAISVFVVQGTLVSLAGFLEFLQQPIYMRDFSGVGGLMLLGLGIRLLEIKEIKVGNFLPALGISPLLTYLAQLFI